MKCKIREICGDWALDIDGFNGGKITIYFNSRQNALNVKRILEVDDSIPNAATVCDMQEVKHGKWELKSVTHRLIDDFDEEFYVECPFCHRTEYVDFEFDKEEMLKHAKEQYPYCHCGARMDGEQ